jgi:hypothetical protein
VSIGAISGGDHRGLVWDYYQELKASQPASASAGSVAALASSTASASATDVVTGQAGGADGFSRLRDDIRALAADSASASGAASDNIANAGTALSSGGTLSATVLSDLTAIAQDLTGIFNGQTPAVTTETASADTGAPAIAGARMSGDSNDIVGRRHYGGHDFQAFPPVDTQPIAQGLTLAPTTNTEIDQLVAGTASRG